MYTRNRREPLIPQMGFKLIIAALWLRRENSGQGVDSEDDVLPGPLSNHHQWLKDFGRDKGSLPDYQRCYHDGAL